MHTIYVASKTKHAGLWRKLRDEGVPIVSTWIDEAGTGETFDHADLAVRRISEASRADVTILFCGWADEIAKGSLIEAGAALASGKPVIQVGHCLNSESALRHHPLWRQVDTIGQALSAASGCEREGE